MRRSVIRSRLAMVRRLKNWSIILTLGVGTLISFGCASSLTQRGTAAAERCPDAPLMTPQPCEIRVLSYNVHGISPWLNLYPGIEAGDERSRSANMGWFLRDYDLVLLQEDFEFHSSIIKGPAYNIVERGTGPRLSPVITPLRIVTFPLRVVYAGLDALGMLVLPFRAPYGSGLTILAPSATVVEPEVTREALPDCQGWFAEKHKHDCWSTKGFVRVRVTFPNSAEVDVYTTHLDAGRDEADRDVRRKQLQFLRRRIEQLSPDRAIIIGGDFNSTYDRDDGTPASGADFDDLVKHFINPLQVKDSGARPQDTTYWGKRIDYIFYRSGKGAQMTLVEAGENKQFRYPDNRKELRFEQYKDLLSDHPAIEAVFSLVPWTGTE